MDKNTARYEKVLDLEEFIECEEHLVEEHTIGCVSIFVYESDGEERTYIVDGFTGHFCKRVQPLNRAG